MQGKMVSLTGVRLPFFWMLNTAMVFDPEFTAKSIEPLAFSVRFLRKVLVQRAAR
jgi:hypothetical protein